MKKAFLFLCLIFGMSACSRSKGYFSIHQSPQPSKQKNVQIAPKEPILLAIGDQQAMAVLPESPAPQPSVSHVMDVQVKQESLAPMPTVRVDQQVSKKEIKAIIQQMKLQNKVVRKTSLNNSNQASSASNWDPKLKIGLILLGVGIILSIFGLGLIGGLSALIGLAFTIIGLLHTY